jgi:hypothetical protein
MKPSFPLCWDCLPLIVLCSVVGFHMPAPLGLLMYDDFFYGSACTMWQPSFGVCDVALDETVVISFSRLLPFPKCCTLWTWNWLKFYQNLSVSWLSLSILLNIEIGIKRHF